MLLCQTGSGNHVNWIQQTHSWKYTVNFTAPSLISTLSGENSIYDNSSSYQQLVSYQLQKLHPSEKAKPVSVVI